MSTFVGHEPCPRCGSRDNLGVWDDGHKYCFGCRFFIPSPENIEQLKKKAQQLENNKNNDFMLDTSGFTYRIPSNALSWLTKYGISRQEVEHYGICWNTNTDSLVFPIYNSQKAIIYCQERYFGSDIHHAKYVTHGSKTQQLAQILNRNAPRTVVLVEDFISAIKVGRVCTSSPLLGSTIDPNAVRWVTERFNKVRVWLDLDKATQALHEASKLALAIPNTRVIITVLDPKEYSTQEILQKLNEYKTL